jgi:hypothetical protein
MESTIKTVGAIIPFVVLIIVVVWFVITRPSPENQDSISQRLESWATKEPNDVIYTCRNVAQQELRAVDNLDNSTNEDAGGSTELLPACDKQMLIYRNQCQENSPKPHCNNPALEGYFLLRKS